MSPRMPKRPSTASTCQLAEDRIQKIDPKTGRVLATIPAPGRGGDSGLTWAEGTLWVGQYRDRKIHHVQRDLFTHRGIACRRPSSAAARRAKKPCSATITSALLTCS
jgi:hypothetical protein